MKKRCLAVLMAVCVVLGTVIAPRDVSAAEIIDTVLEEEPIEEIEEPSEAEPETPLETEPGELPETEPEAPSETAAEIPAEEEFPTDGLLPVEELTVPEEEAEYFEETAEYSLRSSADDYGSEWEKYTNYYFYNQMNEAEREYWDALQAMCIQYTEQNTPGIAVKSGGVQTGKYRTELVKSNMGLSLQEMKQIARIFRYNNPQYYFLNNAIWSTSSAVGFGIYSAFAGTEDRKAATEQVKRQVDMWQAQIDACSTDVEKVKLIHDLIIEKVEYNHAINESGFDENTQYTQSAYSVFCTDSTVCAGYAQSFEMMCNGSGIDAVAVTSSNHEWNKVRINDSWYNVDCTWDDAGNGYPIYYDFFAKNDAYYDNAQQASSHAEESYWNKYLPPCTLTSTSSGWVAGTFPAITQTAQAPKISAKTDSEGDCEVTITAPAAGARIYYTLDGTVPEESTAKSIRYDDSFYIDKSATINAIAVCDGYWDSAVTGKSIDLSKKVTVTYNGNGATSGKMSKQTGYRDSIITLKNNAFKKTGYSFAGWNTKKNGKGKSYTNKQKVSSFTGTVTLYAQWERPTYKITYKLDGGKNNKSNPATYKKTTKTITLKNATKTGYTFKGWYSDKNFKNKVTSIKKGSTGNKTLYAKWEANKYTIKFNGNGSTGGKMSSLTNCKYGKSYKLTANKFKKSGYTFVGWNTKKNGSGKTYKNKQSIKNLTSKNGGTVTLYAQWMK